VGKAAWQLVAILRTFAVTLIGVVAIRPLRFVR
jgi:hypothetical protein